MLNINLKRIMVVSFLNHFIKKKIKEFDGLLSNSSNFNTTFLYICNDCKSVLNSNYLIYKNNNITCPFCFEDLQPIEDIITNFKGDK